MDLIKNYENKNIAIETSYYRRRRTFNVMSSLLSTTTKSFMTKQDSRSTILRNLIIIIFAKASIAMTDVTRFAIPTSSTNFASKSSKISSYSSFRRNDRTISR